MKKKIKIIVLVLVVLGLAGVGVGLYMYYKPTKDFASAKTDYTLSAQQLFADFVADELAANTKYVNKDKTIELSGLVQSVTANSDSTTSIILAVGSADGDISCTLTKEASAQTSIQANSNITLKGQCTGLQELISKEVIMIRCVVVK